MDKPVVGQILYSLNVGDAARNCAQKLTPMRVTKVGRKYFTLVIDNRDNDWSATQFHIETWCENTEYASDHYLYKTEQEWLDERESFDICKRMWKRFEYGKNVDDITLPALRTMAAIVAADTAPKE